MNELLLATKVFCCYFKNNEWACFVLASSRGQAKSIFYQFWHDEGEWNDIRCYTVKSVPAGISVLPQCLDNPEDPTLKLLELSYVEEDL